MSTVTVDNGGLTDYAVELGAGVTTADTQRIAIATDGNVVNTGLTQPLTDTELRASAVPVSGTVTANLAAGTNNIGDVDVLSLPAIPAGNNNIGDVDIASVPAPLSTSGHGTAAAALRVELPTDGTGVIATVGAVTSLTNALPAGTNAIGKLAANSGVDIGDVDVTSAVVSSITGRLVASTATLTNVNDTNVSTTLLALNTSRLAAYIHNDSTSILYVKFGTTASTTSYTVKLIADAFYELPNNPIYTGRIDGIWSADSTGAARITELTA